MNAPSAFRIGFLSIITAAGLLVASNGIAADLTTKSETEGWIMKPKAVSGDSKISEISAPPRQVVDTKGNVYLLVPLQTKDGKMCGEPVHEYMPRIDS